MADADKILPGVEISDFPKAPQQEHGDIFFFSPPEAHSTGSSSCVLLSRYFLFAR
jgi:hypothetical protein